MNKKVVPVLSALIGMVVGAAAGSCILIKKDVESDNKMSRLAAKHLSLFLLMNQWMKTKQEGKSILSYFTKNGYRTIAIYGMSYVGETLLEELKGAEIEIAYAIDKGAAGISKDIDIVSPEECLGDVDVIVVTAITYFDEIKDNLKERVKCPIVSLEDILYEI